MERLRSNESFLLYHNQLWVVIVLMRRRIILLLWPVDTGLVLGISKKKNYVIQAKFLETGTTDNVLGWHRTLHEIFKKRTCNSALPKFVMVEPLLGGQDEKDLRVFTKTITKYIVVACLSYSWKSDN